MNGFHLCIYKSVVQEGIKLSDYGRIWAFREKSLDLFRKCRVEELMFAHITRKICTNHNEIFPVKISDSIKFSGAQGLMIMKIYYPYLRRTCLINKMVTLIL